VLQQSLLHFKAVVVFAVVVIVSSSITSVQTLTREKIVARLFANKQINNNNRATQRDIEARNARLPVCTTWHQRSKHAHRKRTHSQNHSPTHLHAHTHK